MTLETLLEITKSNFEGRIFAFTEVVSQHHTMGISEARVAGYTPVPLSAYSGSYLQASEDAKKLNAMMGLSENGAKMIAMSSMFPKGNFSDEDFK